MLSSNFIKLFVSRLVLIYVLLLLPWPGLNEAYGRFLRDLGQAVFAREPAERHELIFEAAENDSPDAQDSRVVIINRALMAPDGSGPVRYLHFDAQHFGKSPMILLIALILATPVSWGRRLRALLLGTLSLHGVLLCLLGVGILNEATEISLLTLSPFWKAIASGCSEVLTGQISLVIPVLVWILVTFRREDILPLLNVPPRRA